jgi:hypothetical protein
MPRKIKFNKTNVTKLLIELQDYGSFDSNVFATKAVKDFGLRKLHQKLTRNPDSAYKIQK